MDGRDKKSILMDYAVMEFGSPGILMDPTVARRTPCRCYTYKGKPKLCFSEGIVGAMSKTQIESFCNPLIKLGESKTLSRFEKASKRAKKKIKSTPKGKKLEKWIKVMGEELKDSGRD